MFMTAVVAVLTAYIFGSINFAVIFTKVFTHTDVRDYGSGNAGTTNVMRVGGMAPGILTFVCDALKGFVACAVGQWLFSYIFEQTGDIWALPIYGAYICGLACMIGHIFPVFFGFKGGKGVATSVGIFAVCCPIAIILGLTVFAVVLLISRIVSLSSLVATVVVVVLSIVFKSEEYGASWLPQTLLAIIMGAIVFIKHSENIKRLIAGKEKKISVRSRKNG